MLEEDVRLASLVATGKFRESAGAVIDALFKSTMHKTQRSHCPRETKHSDHVPLAEGAA